MEAQPNTTEVKIRRIFHRDKFRLGLFFPYNNALVQRFRAIDARYSATYKCWYVTDEEGMLQKIKNAAKGIAYTDWTKLNEMLSKEALKVYMKSVNLPTYVDRENLVHLDRFKLMLKSRGMSENSIATYGNVITKLIKYSADVDISKVDVAYLRKFLARECYDRKFSAAYHRQIIAALCKFYNGYLEATFDVKEVLPAPSKSRTLPTVLSEEEVIRLLAAIKNMKHRVAIAMLYACGLRIGELLNLKVSHIDFDRMQLRVVNGKGRKDRMVNMAASMLPLLRNYLTTYQPAEYLLNGQSDVKYSPESVRSVIKRARHEAGISKTVTPHTLRHSYATHMMDSGVGLRHIQVLLGHSRPETTMIYTHISKEQLGQVESPLDKLVRGLNHNKNIIENQ